MATRKKKQEPVANTIMDFVTESPPVFVPKPKPVKINGEDYFIVKVTGMDGKVSQHPVTGWKLSSWLRFYNGLNSIVKVEHELSTREVYNQWMYCGLEEEQQEKLKKPRKKKEVVEEQPEPVVPAKKPRKKRGNPV